MADTDKLMMTYFKTWPKPTNYYVQDLIWAMKVGMQYLGKVKDKPSSNPKCVVFDFDDCLVFGDPANVVGVKEMELGEHDGSEIFILPRNEPIVKLAEYAKANGFQIIILTARPAESKEATRWNSQMLKIPFDAVVMNDGDSDPCFKVNVRRRIAKKYDIMLTVGDQITDCLSPGRAAFIKLPGMNYENLGGGKKVFTDISLASYAWLP